MSRIHSLVRGDSIRRTRPHRTKSLEKKRTYTPHYAAHPPRARPSPSRSFPRRRRHLTGGGRGAGGRRRWRARLWRRTWSWTARTWRTTSHPTRSRRRRPGISICNRPRACLSQSLLFRSLTLVLRLYTGTYEAFCALLLPCRRDLLDISPVLTEAAGAIVDVSASRIFKSSEIFC